MKRIILLIVLLSISTIVKSQSLVENKVDEFTEKAIKRTSWETMTMKFGFVTYFRVSSVNHYKYFDLKMMIGSDGKVFSISKDQELMLKLDNGEIVKLKNIESTVTCRGCGAKGLSGSSAHGIKVSYSINQDEFNLLKNNLIKKYRVYTNDGYYEKELKSKQSKKIIKALELIE